MNIRKQRRILLAAKRIELSGLFDELTATKLLLIKAYSVFNSTIDPELIESSVYEISSLNSKYSYLIRRIKDISKTDPNDRLSLRDDNAVGSPKGDPV